MTWNARCQVIILISLLLFINQKCRRQIHAVYIDVKFLLRLSDYQFLMTQQLSSLRKVNTTCNFKTLNQSIWANKKLFDRFQACLAQFWPLFWANTVPVGCRPTKRLFQLLDNQHHYLISQVNFVKTCHRLIKQNHIKAILKSSKWSKLLMTWHSLTYL